MNESEDFYSSYCTMYCAPLSDIEDCFWCPEPFVKCEDCPHLAVGGDSHE